MKKYFMIWWMLFSFGAYAQNTNFKKWSVSGYIRDMQYFRFGKPFSKILSTNQLHNRINLAIKPTQKTEFRFSLRNRFYWGDDVILNTDFKNQIGNKDESVKLSTIWISEKSFLLHSNIERLWFENRKKKWNVRVGRQRINWGINNTWNPNDIFNSYNLFDFDYEERPGSDAIKFQYLINELSNIEFVYSITNNKPISGIRYFTNYKKYDLQFIAGDYKGIITAGIGWAGNISKVGFKGECQFYKSKEEPMSQINLSVEGDYTFKKGWYLSSSLLYNNKIENYSLLNSNNIGFKNTPRSLMPEKWNFIINTSKEITPIFNAAVNLIYCPEADLIIFFPNATYSLKKNLDADITGKSLFIKTKNYEAISQNVYIRLKWNF